MIPVLASPFTRSCPVGAIPLASPPLFCRSNSCTFQLTRCVVPMVRSTLWLRVWPVLARESPAQAAPTAGGMTSKSKPSPATAIDNFDQNNQRIRRHQDRKGVKMESHSSARAGRSAEEITLTRQYISSEVRTFGVSSHALPSNRDQISLRSFDVVPTASSYSGFGLHSRQVAVHRVTFSQNPQSCRV